jgi:alkaline phosphatase D
MMDKHLSRRAVMAQAGAAAFAMAAPAWGQERQVARIAFGSCARQNKDQPIWDTISAAQPDLFVHLGDAVYADTESPATMARAYAALAAKPGFQRLRAQTPMIAIWDDHDYGANDAGADYPMKDEARRQFCDFWGEAAGSLRRTQAGGIYTASTLGPPGQRVQMILPDLRFSRQAGDSSGGFLRQARQYLAGQIFRGHAIAGPYRTVDDPSATAMLGAEQWAWLEAQFAQPADLRILCSSLQVLSQGTGWEAWEQFPAERARLLALAGQARNVVFISGDVHYGEVSLVQRPGAGPLVELTSSGLTEVWAALPPNAHRAQVYRGRNFGLIEIDWAAGQVALQARDEGGAVQINHAMAFR